MASMSGALRAGGTSLRSRPAKLAWANGALGSGRSHPRPVGTVSGRVLTPRSSGGTVTKNRRAMEHEVGSKASCKRKAGDRSRTERPEGGVVDLEWPSIAKKISLESQLTVLGRGDDLGLFTVRGVFSEAECHRFVEAAESRRFQHQGSRGPKFGEAYRDNGRLAVDDADLAQSIWDSGLGSLLVKVLQIEGKWPSKFNPNVRIYKYEKGQNFGKHVDESVQVDRGLYTGYTLLVYLSGGRTTAHEKEALKGGETVFYGRRGAEVAKVAPEVGLALLHVHGDRCLLHEAREVKQGVKYVLRSDVVFE
eukprot:TRINITY_DN18335_c0_g1_i1.p1 TRINITY_DN18335_c0_g1~~TRINITY_DN18335_c0_g1_i1.p1  ORF type:complete len:307 (+),score=3.21 TRINITY_DN18335_c0_g1_i1:20-940(+)